MRRARSFGRAALSFALAASVMLAAAFAQDDQEAAEEDADDKESIEEIIVVAPKPGDRRRVDPDFEDPVKAKLLKDFYRMKEDQEEFEWRKSAAAENDSRITWGYDPSDEYEMRKQMDLQELPSERTRPATLFKIRL